MNTDKIRDRVTSSGPASGSVTRLVECRPDRDKPSGGGIVQRAKARLPEVMIAGKGLDDAPFAMTSKLMQSVRDQVLSGLLPKRANRRAYQDASV